MIDPLIQQLHDSVPEVRRRAIMALGRSKDEAALNPLAEVVINDPDPALRELARKAGQYIRRHMNDETRPRSTSPFDEAQPLSQAPTIDTDHLTVKARFDRLISSEREIYESGEAERERQNQAVEHPKEEEKPVEAPLLTASGFELVRGRQYNIAKENVARAKLYIDTALTLNIDGDNARALKNLAEALSFNPNLINDNYFNNVASTVTGKEGGAAIQMIIDRNQRKKFAETAIRAQKDQRVEQHLSEAKQSTWTDVWFELTIYGLIVVIGSILTTLITAEMAQNLIANFPQPGDKGQLPDALAKSQAAFASLTFGSLLPRGIVSGISGVLSLVLLTVLVHFIAKALGGTGTWRHLIRVLISFYNKWLPILFVLLYVTIAVTFISLFSPVVLCFLLVLLGLSLYVSGKTSSKVGEAYDFGAGKGCVSVMVSSLVIVILNVALLFFLAQSITAFSGTPI